jgi:hypothetical protein
VILPISASCVGWLHRSHPSYWLRWGSCKLFCLGCPRTMIFLISASQVARIIGMSHQCLIPLPFLRINRQMQQTQSEKSRMTRGSWRIKVLVMLSPEGQQRGCVKGNGVCNGWRGTRRWVCVALNPDAVGTAAACPTNLPLLSFPQETLHPCSTLSLWISEEMLLELKVVDPAGKVAHACNPCYMRGGDGEAHSSKPTRVKKLARYHLNS